MQPWFCLSYIWLVGLRDLLLTHTLLSSGPMFHELNPLARSLAAALGPAALAPLKLAGLTTYSAAVLALRRTRRETSQRLLAAGLLASLALSGWWDCGLLLVSSF
jgi:hypothetical protein